MSRDLIRKLERLLEDERERDDLTERYSELSDDELRDMLARTAESIRTGTPRPILRPRPGDDDGERDGLNTYERLSTEELLARYRARCEELGEERVARMFARGVEYVPASPPAKPEPEPEEEPGPEPVVEPEPEPIEEPEPEPDVEEADDEGPTSPDPEEIAEPEPEPRLTTAEQELEAYARTAYKRNAREIERRSRDADRAARWRANHWPRDWTMIS